MKKITLFILGIFILTSALVFAGDVQKIDQNAWLAHTSKMQTLRENIMSLITKKMPTISDRAELASLLKTFNNEKDNWEKYIEKVAKDTSTPKSLSKANKCPNCNGKCKTGMCKANKCPNCNGKCKAGMCKANKK